MTDSSSAPIIELPADKFDALYTDVCDAIERNFLSRVAEVNADLPFIPGDGLSYSSSAARATATDIFAMFGVTITRSRQPADPVVRPDLDRLLTPAETAEYLGVTVATLYQWRHKKKGPTAIRVGKHLRYRETDVQKWIGSR